MKVTETTEVTKPVKETVTKAVLCDRCGKDILTSQYSVAGTHFELNFGWGSRFDDEWWKVDCCDDCAEWLTGEFKTVQRE